MYVWKGLLASDKSIVRYLPNKLQADQVEHLLKNQIFPSGVAGNQKRARMSEPVGQKHDWMNANTNTNIHRPQRMKHNEFDIRTALDKNPKLTFEIWYRYLCFLQDVL